MTVVILQPGYLPWLGFFHQMYVADVFVVYDDVQYDKGSWRNRNRIKTANGVQWLTVPVLTKGRKMPSIKEVRINNESNWRRKHLESLVQAYGKTRYFDEYIKGFEHAYGREWELLIDLDMYFINYLAECLGCKTRLEYASNLGVDGIKTERLVRICQALGSTEYFQGAAGRNYIDERLFFEVGIRLRYQDYVHPEYEQLYGEFVPYLSAVDLLFNHGPESLGILLSTTEEASFKP